MSGSLKLASGKRLQAHHPETNINERGDQKMRINRVALLIGFAITAVLFFEVAAHADEADQSTKLTFNKRVEIPGQVLSAGTYLFKVDPDNLNIVRVFNADGTHLYALLQTISAERPQPSGDTVVTLGEQSTGGPDALMKWFYPGRTIGHEFIYSKHEEQQLAQYRQQTIEAKQTAEAGD
jgi:hypothetical protein